MRHLAAATLLAGLAGLSAPAQSAELKMWVISNSPPLMAFLTQAEAAFQKTHPDFKLTVEQIPNEAYKTQLPVAMSGSAPPDVFFNWAGEYSERFARDGLALDITDYGAKPGGFKQSLSQAWQDSFSYKGRNFGVPTEAVSKYFEYDKAYFAEHKLTPPADFDGLIGLCKAIRTIDPATVPWPLGNSERWVVNHVITMLNERVLGNAATKADYDLSAPADTLFADPGYVEAWQKLVDLQDAGCFQDAPNATSPEAADQMFSAQISPMTFCGSWCLANFDKEGYTGYALFRFPAIAGGKGDPTATFLVPQGFQVAAKSAQPELAADWLSFLVSDEQAAAFSKLLGALPSNPKLIETVGGTEQFNWIAKDVGSATGTVMVLNVLLDNAVSEAYLDAGVEVLNRTKTPAQAMADIRRVALDAKARVAAK